MKKSGIIIVLLLLVNTLSAQENPTIIKKNSLLFVEIGYQADFPYKNVKYKIAVQHTFWDFIGVSTGLWHYSDQYMYYDQIKGNISITSLDVSLGMVPVYTKHNFLSLGVGFSYGHINLNKPYEVLINRNTGEVKPVLTTNINSSTGGWHFYLQYHYNFRAFFVGTGLYYYSFNDIDDRHTFSGFNANIVFGIQFK